MSQVQPLILAIDDVYKKAIHLSRPTTVIVCQTAALMEVYLLTYTMSYQVIP